ncbi:MAG: hypothetical protein WBY71_07205, partial [Nitrososphaeraceae archaeon]
WDCLYQKALSKLMVVVYGLRIIKMEKALRLHSACQLSNSSSRTELGEGLNGLAALRRRILIVDD